MPARGCPEATYSAQHHAWAHAHTPHADSVCVCVCVRLAVLSCLGVRSSSYQALPKRAVEYAASKGLLTLPDAQPLPSPTPSTVDAAGALISDADGSTSPTAFSSYDSEPPSSYRQDTFGTEPSHSLLGQLGRWPEFVVRCLAPSVASKLEEAARSASEAERLRSHLLASQAELEGTRAEVAQLTEDLKNSILALKAQTERQTASSATTQAGTNATSGVVVVGNATSANANGLTSAWSATISKLSAVEARLGAVKSSVTNGVPSRRYPLPRAQTPPRPRSPAAQPRTQSPHRPRSPSHGKSTSASRSIAVHPPPPLKLSEPTITEAPRGPPACASTPEAAAAAPTPTSEPFATPSPPAYPGNRRQLPLAARHKLGLSSEAEDTFPEADGHGPLGGRPAELDLHYGVNVSPPQPVQGASRVTRSVRLAQASAMLAQLSTDAQQLPSVPPAVSSAPPPPGHSAELAAVSTCRPSSPGARASSARAPSAAAVTAAAAGTAQPSCSNRLHIQPIPMFQPGLLGSSLRARARQQPPPPAPPHSPLSPPQPAPLPDDPMPPGYIAE